MMTAGFFLRFGCTTAAVVAGGLLAGCSTGQASAPPGQPSGQVSPSLHVTPTPPPASHSQRPDPYPALCRTIDPADVQALFSKPLGPMTTGGSSDCQFSPDGSDDVDTLKVYLRIDDGDKTLFDHIGDISYGTFNPLTGLGFQAKWGSTPGSAPTVVDVRNGNFTCTVIPPPSVADLTLIHTGSAIDPKVSPAAAAAYARKISVICQDVFAHS